MTWALNSISEYMQWTNSSECIWLAITFISSTDSCVIGYNVQQCKNTWLSRFNAAVNTFHFIFPLFVKYFILLYSSICVSTSGNWGYFVMEILRIVPFNNELFVEVWVYHLIVIASVILPSLLFLSSLL